jgi:hypothetical protein
MTTTMMIIIIYNITVDAATVSTTTDSTEFKMFAHSSSPVTGKH